MVGFRKLLILFLCVVGGIAVAAYYTVYLRREALKPWRRFQVVFEDVGGLRKKNPVMIRGARMGRVADVQLKRKDDGDPRPAATPVGEVVDVRLHKDTKVIVTLEVEPGLELRRDVNIEIVSLSALGNAGIELTPARGTNAKPIVGGETLTGTLRPGVGDDGADGPERRRSLKVWLDQLNRESAALLQPDSSFLASLLSDSQRGRDMRAAVNELEASSAGLAASLRRFERGADPNALLSAEGLVALTQTTAALNTTLTGVRDGLRGVEREEGTGGALLADPSVGAGVRETLREQGETWRAARRGEGLLGELTADTALHDGALAAARQVDQTVTAGERGEGLLGPLLDAERGQAAREFVQGLADGTETLRESSLIEGGAGVNPGKELVETLDDLVNGAQDALRNLRDGLSDKTLQGAVFAVF